MDCIEYFNEVVEKANNSSRDEDKTNYLLSSIANSLAEIAECLKEATYEQRHKNDNC